MKKFEEKTIDTEKIFDGKVIKLQVDSVTLPDGNTSKRELIKHPGAVAIIALTEENNIVFVEQYRKALEKSILEIPAGKLEDGEAPEVTAKRELEEETGYTTDHLELVTSFYTSPGFADELVYVYFTNQLKRLQEDIAGDEDEFVEKYELPLGEAERLMEEKRIHDAKTAYALLYLKTRGE
ncbi:ADP-ribose diphosphatase [Thalassobacillus devorans]|uniref:ADP-ribose diphosphatase n=1 Tax=Thalassobacillus devorans TaxID=279813 RepID=A0ABQ1P0Q1_9BACI|nr:NUDIX hydrolase [Thalassobacillus devorans]NIK28386.1 ADP-ribose pyrophosphatase [Thalassobacillus devorans]GGC86750.1 ADP-ribose diphosphatase [Thalassobacillus devorans]